MNVRRAVVASALSLGLLSLAACGGDSSGAGLEAVKISGKTGEAPTVSYGDDFDPDEVEVKVLTAGKGDTVEKDDAADVHIWMGNSVDESVPFNTYEEGQKPLDVIVSDLMPGLQKAIEDQKVGSVVAVAGVGSELFSEYGYPEWGIGNGDAVVIRAEIVKKYSDAERDELKKSQDEAEAAAKKQQEDAQKAQADTEKKKAEVLATALPKAEGKPVRKAAWAPKVDFSTEVPTLSFAGTPEPSGKLQVTELIRGKGKKLAEGDHVAVKYVGQVHGGKEPFDSSYSRGDMLDFTVGAGQMIPGFDQAVEGRTVGSRIIIQIPPELGYGKDGREPSIKGTDTLVFAVDIVGGA